MAADKVQQSEPMLIGGDTHLVDTIDRSQRQPQAKQWKTTVGARKVVLQEQFEQLMKVGTVLKNVASAAGLLVPDPSRTALGRLLCADASSTLLLWLPQAGMDIFRL